MKFKKLLLVISVVIISMFGLMLTTSYAWYSFENASTTFEAVTTSDKIYVSYQNGQYINTDVAVPLESNQVDMYSSKNNFNIRVEENDSDEDILIKVSLVEVTIDSALRNSSFKVELYYQGSRVDEVTGSSITTGNNIVFDNVVLDNDLSNQFEIRVYVLDDGSDQSAMMNKTFKAKVKVDVVSRLKPVLEDYSNPDIYVDNITIDGASSNSLPTDGYYNMSASCTKGSVLTWDSLSKTITYNSGSSINDTCNLTFTSSTDYPLLNTMKKGSYVAYTGTNGCVGLSCKGQNANYVNDNDMGYCDNEGDKFGYNGWRVAYIENGNAYLISAGATDCVATSSDGSISNIPLDETFSLVEGEFNLHFQNLNKLALNYCNSNYVSGGVCNDSTVWAIKFVDLNKIVNVNTSISNCVHAIGNYSCGFTNNLIDNGGKYWFSDVYVSDSFYSWNGEARFVNAGRSYHAYGVRPVIKMEASIFVRSGSGTYDDPYIIGYN